MIKSSISIPSRSSGQPVDLIVVESARTLKQWDTYRHETTPIYTTMCTSDANGNMTCTQMLMGFSDDYYRDVIGQVERSAAIDVYAKGASANGFPPESKVGQLEMVVSIQNEVLATYGISSGEYYSHSR